MRFQSIALLIAACQLGQEGTYATATATATADDENNARNNVRRRNLTGGGGGGGGGGKREFVYRNTQIMGYRYFPNDDFDEFCWALKGGSTREGTMIVLQRCDDKDDAQKFHIESYATGKNGRPSWEEAYDAATVVNDCDYCDFGGPGVIRSKLDPSMVVSVNRAAEKAALRIKRVGASQLSYEENIFSDLEGGEVILGDGACNYFDDCLFAVNQGLTPNIGDPVMLRSGKTLLHRKDDDFVYGSSRGDIIASWQPFGS
jgi:hypothetical protein